MECGGARMVYPTFQIIRKFKYLVRGAPEEVIELPRDWLYQFRKELVKIGETPAGQVIYYWNGYYVMEWRDGTYSIFDKDGIHVCDINLPNWNSIEILF